MYSFVLRFWRFVSLILINHTCLQLQECYITRRRRYKYFTPFTTPLFLMRIYLLFDCSQLFVRVYWNSRLFQKFLEIFPRIFLKSCFKGWNYKILNFFSFSFFEMIKWELFVQKHGTVLDDDWKKVQKPHFKQTLIF